MIVVLGTPPPMVKGASTETGVGVGGLNGSNEAGMLSVGYGINEE